MVSIFIFCALNRSCKQIGEGLSPAQVILDQAAHLMDAVAIGRHEWNIA